MVSYLVNSTLTEQVKLVLILVVMDNGLVLIINLLNWLQMETVLILVVMDNGLVPIDVELTERTAGES